MKALPPGQDSRPENLTSTRKLMHLLAEVTSWPDVVSSLIFFGFLTFVAWMLLRDDNTD